MSFFTVIIPTRDRPVEFQLALDSVLSQTCADVEIVVVDDGTDKKPREALEKIKADVGGKIKWVHLNRRTRGHGRSFAQNSGVAVSTGEYLCTLDDDDTWTDNDYLKRVRSVIEGCEKRVDLHLTNQVAYFKDEKQPGPAWIEDLTEIFHEEKRTPNSQGVFSVEIDDLLRLGGFCHLNTTIVRRGLYEAVGGIDESIRYEEDRDLYLRLIDNAETIVYSPTYVSRHNIPDAAKNVNLSTSVSLMQKRLSQSYIFQKSSLFANHPSIRAYCQRQNAYILKHITEELVEENRLRNALYFARQGLGAFPSLKWAAYVGILSIRYFYRRVIGNLDNK